MVDVVISYARENEATARQLAEAVGREGHAVWRSEGGSDAASADAVTDRIGEAKAVIVIWSEAASASEWIRAEANIARGMRKLVQASADDKPPPIPFDPSQVASISTWLGDDRHQGWAAIRAGLASLCGPRPAGEGDMFAKAPAAAIAPAPPAPPEPAPAPPPAPGPIPPIPPEPATEPAPPPAPAPTGPESLSTPAPSKGPGALVIALIAVVLVALLAAGAWFWMRSRAPAPAGQEDAAAPQPAAAAPGAGPAGPGAPASGTAAPANERFDREAVLQGAGFAIVRNTPTAIGLTVGRIDAGEVFSTYEQTGPWWRVRTAAGVTGYLNASNVRLREAAGAAQAGAGQPSQAERRAEPPRPRGPRIRKENSENMRLFCEGAGLGTPQCRQFRRSTY